MKSGFNQFKAAWIMVLFWCITAPFLTGQSLPQVNIRFTNPSFDMASRQYYLDVEMSTQNTREFFFGMNLRFFYDASLLEFQHVDQFSRGYGILGDAPKAHVGNNTSGAQLFNFARTAGYVNGAVQLLDEQFPLEIFPTKWVKAFRLVFKVPVLIQNEQEFCPSVIWDMEYNIGDGGFLAGGDGVVITVLEGDSRTRQESAPTISVGTAFNWQYSTEAGMPYGQPISQECISTTNTVSAEEPDVVDANGYALFQNKPNPFDQRTLIEFILPFAQEGTLILYDVSGAVREEIKGEFIAGKNQIELKQKSWMVQSNVVYYRLQTEKFTSGSRKMTLVRA